MKDHRRAEYVLATKVFFPTGPGPNDKGLSRKHVVENCHQSLRRLKTDYLDLLQCHRFDPDTPLEETVRAMDDLVPAGGKSYTGVLASGRPTRSANACKSAATVTTAPVAASRGTAPFNRRPKRKSSPPVAPPASGRWYSRPSPRG